MGDENEKERNWSPTERYVRRSLQYFMGELLDMVRVTDIGDRQMGQFEKTIKAKANNLADAFVQKLHLKEEK